MISAGSSRSSVARPPTPARRLSVVMTSRLMSFNFLHQAIAPLERPFAQMRDVVDAGRALDQVVSQVPVGGLVGPREHLRGVERGDHSREYAVKWLLDRFQAHAKYLLACLLSRRRFSRPARLRRGSRDLSSRKLLPGSRYPAQVGHAASMGSRLRFRYADRVWNQGNRVGQANVGQADGLGSFTGLDPFHGLPERVPLGDPLG